MHSEITGLFASITVIDVSSVLAGPQAGSFFAELGAKVIKVEHKSAGGDPTNQWRLPSESNDNPVSAYYAAANTGKELLLLDLDKKKDYEHFLSLVATADVVISNYQKRVAEHLRVTYRDLQKVNDGIVFAQLSAYEYDDPRPGYDLIMQAETGWISMTGSDSNHVAKLPVALIDVIASHQIREAVLIGLLRKLKTGKGSEVHVSLYKSAISALANQATNYLMSDHVPQPIGTLHPNIAPYGDIFTTRDSKSLIFVIGSDAQFVKLGKTLNLAVGDCVTFQYNRDRVAKRKMLQTLIQQKVELHDLNDIEQSLSSASVPYCTLKNLDQVFTSDLSRQMIKSENIQGQTTKKVSNISFSFLSVES